MHWSLHGEGEPLFLGFPLMASQAEVFGPEAATIQKAFLDGLTDRYAVLLADYPSIGKSTSIDPLDLTPERVCADLLSVADAAGFDRFSYWGYSWGGAVSLQLAARTDRLKALVMGGWIPLGGQYADMLAASLEQVDDPPPEVQVVLRSPAQYRQWVTFYEALQDWSEEQSNASINCPRLVFVGGEGDVLAGSYLIRNATTLRQRQKEVEAAGWQVEFIPGRGHEVGLDAQAVLPMARAFLDRHLFDE